MVRRSLLRFELVDLLVRVAEVKFIKTQVARSYSKALEMLLNDLLYPLCRFQEWHRFREDHVLAAGVSEVLQANSDNLKKLFSETSQACSTANFAQIVDLLSSESEIGLPHQLAMECVAYSKATVAKETEKLQEYDRFRFAEFLEAIVRAAFWKFHGSDMETIPLEKKVQHTLDDLLSGIGLRRTVARPSEGESSSSDVE